MRRDGRQRPRNLPTIKFLSPRGAARSVRGANIISYPTSMTRLADCGPEQGRGRALRVVQYCIIRIAARRKSTHYTEHRSLALLLCLRASLLASRDLHPNR